MDAYCLVRFIYLCLRMCFFASFWGMVVLTPVYAYGGAGAQSIDYITLANVEEGSNRLVRGRAETSIYTLHIISGIIY